ncbi:DUF6233 domain-containing protein [Streptomyces sp. NPDC008141]|uniref:DUF6233 domain-containing protein n=1 Tax=Streptomyces sp. NPDC008141 TaxID=3364815 RepID=UPI0036F0B0EA
MCNTGLRARQVITAQEARRLITDGVRACVLCRPDTDLGINSWAASMGNAGRSGRQGDSPESRWPRTARFGATGSRSF